MSGMARMVATFVAASLVVVGVGQAVAAPEQVSAAAPQERVAKPDRQRDMSPVAVARRTGKRVEVAAKRTEFRQVFANPNGSFTAEFTVTPERVRRGDGWVPVDTKLAFQDDGAVAPAAVTEPLTFSGGGDGPLVSYGTDLERMELRWPTALPKPTLSGGSATYAEVLPGVDLRLTASAQGFSKVLVVKTPEAGRQKALSKIRFGLATEGITVNADKHGGLVATDKGGAEVFRTGRAEMWDSPAAGVTETTRGEHQAVGRLEVSDTEIAIVPDHKLLTDPDANYPVYIDPPVSWGRQAWANVFSGHPNNSYWYGNGDTTPPVFKVGYCDWDYCGDIGTARTYFQFDIGTVLRGKEIVSAELNTFENWSPSCSPRWVDLYETGAIAPGITWNNQPWAVKRGWHNVAYGYNSSCPARWLGWDVKEAVKRAAGGNISAYMMRAGDGLEGDKFAWKKFDIEPKLSVVYNSYPDVPTGVTADHKACGQAPNEAFAHSATPILRARLTDPDGGLLAAEFEWGHRYQAPIGRFTTPMQSSGTEHWTGLPQGQFKHGDTISYRVRGWDGTSNGAWSPWCEYTVDQVGPKNAPTITSTVYKESAFAGGIGRSGEFTFDAKGDTDVVAFRYGLEITNPVDEVRAGQAGGTAKAWVTPEDDGPMDLYVRSVDRAGNLGPIYKTTQPHGGWHFGVGAGTPPVGRWELDGYGSDKTAPDSSGKNNHGTLTGGASWTNGRVDDAVSLNGTTGYVGTAGRAVGTDGTFTVSAWVKLASDPGGAWKTVVSQDGNRAGGFFLEYNPDVRGWSFAMPTADSDSAGVDRAVAPNSAVVGRWTHLVGVHDMATSKMRLYVDGSLAGEGTHPLRWSAAGPVQIGRGKWAGQQHSYLHGTVDEVRAYDRLLAAGEIEDLANLPSREELLWPLEESSGNTAGDSSGNNRAGRIAGGVTRVDGPVGAKAADFDGTGSIESGGPAVRTDGSFTVSAYVRPSDLDSSIRTAVSQDGNRTSGFKLGYRGDSGRWAFTMWDADVDNPTRVTVEAPDAPDPESFTQLVGVHDAAAKKIRLYINGVRVGTQSYSTPRWNATGPLVVGRAKHNGVLNDYWKGAIDHVQVHTGARTDDQIRAEFSNPAAPGATIYAGQLTEFRGHTGERITTAAGKVPPGYHMTKSFGPLLREDVPGSRSLYSCLLNDVDQFVSHDPACEGQRVLTPLGKVYGAAPAGIPSRAIYRCLDGADHFVSEDPNCDGKTKEFLLGYTPAYDFLVRHVQLGAPYDHTTSSGGVPGSYQQEAISGLVAAKQLPGTVKLMVCADGTDQFASTDATCGGKTVVGQSGWIWTEEPTGVKASAQLFSCRTSWADTFTALDPGCEGETVLGPLGYVVLDY